jgi:ferredoxin
LITAERKPLAEIKESIASYRKILVLGCGSCVAECAAGGEKETALLAAQLRMDARMEGRVLETKELTPDRQCVFQFIDPLADGIGEYEAVLSLACGAGVQAVAEVFPRTPVVPALNTVFLGQTKEAGLWLENCRGCGECKLDFFAGVCPVTRCSKGLFNGPCGGSKNETCEVDPDIPCAWQLIVARLEERGRLSALEKVFPPARWAKKEGRGPRKIRREDQKT